MLSKRKLQQMSWRDICGYFESLDDAGWQEAVDVFACDGYDISDVFDIRKRVSEGPWLIYYNSISKQISDWLGFKPDGCMVVDDFLMEGSLDLEKRYANYFEACQIHHKESVSFERWRDNV